MSGSGGGGGGSGVVTYPAHITAWQDAVLGTGAMGGEDMTVAMVAALGASPYTLVDAYDPDADLVDMIAAPDVLQTLVTLLSTGTTLDTLIGEILDHARIDTAVTEFAADFDARLVADVLPRFHAGMRDINAVVSSSFVIGRALIEENQDRQVAKYSAGIHMKAFSDDAIQVIGLKLQYQQAASMMISDVNRIKIVAKKEEAATNMELDSADALWDLQVFQYGANLLASGGGGTAVPSSNRPSQSQSVLGGAMSGAAAGAMVGSTVPGLGTAYGAAIGAVLGAASGFIA